MKLNLSVWFYCSQAGNGDHMKLLRDMGITVVGLPDGRVQLLHSYSQAKTTEDAEEGLLFMQEMVEISRSTSSQPDNPPRIVSFQIRQSGGTAKDVVLKAGPAQFGLELKDDVKVMARLAIGKPFRMCRDPINGAELQQKIVIIERGDCMFVEKVRININGDLPETCYLTSNRFHRHVGCKRLELLVVL